MKLDGWTLALQTINFLVLVWLLRRFLYAPVTRAIAQRKAASEAALAEAATAKNAADQERAALSAERASVQSERDAVLAHAHAELEAERRSLLEAAQLEVARLHAAGQQQLASENEEAQKAIHHHAAELAIELAAAILRSSASPALAEALTAQAADRLARLPADELGRVRAQIAAGTVLEVVTAPALPPEAEAHLRDRLAAELGASARVRFAADEQLIAGAELRLPTTVISLSWRDALVHAREELGRDVAA